VQQQSRLAHISLHEVTIASLSSLTLRRVCILTVQFVIFLQMASLSLLSLQVTISRVIGERRTACLAIAVAVDDFESSGVTGIILMRFRNTKSFL